MLIDVIKQFSWLDIFVIILLFRICYIAIRTGISVELFKFLGTIAAIYLSLHYYTALSDFIRQRAPIKQMPLDFLDFLFFTVLTIIGYLVFLSLRSIFYRFIKMEAVPNLNKFGGLVLGVARGFLLAGLITFMLVISSIGYLKNSVRNSYFGKYLFKVAPSTYSWLWDAVTSKFMTGEKFNQTVLEVQEGFRGK